MEIKYNRLKDLREDHDYTQQRGGRPPLALPSANIAISRQACSSLTAEVLVSLARFYAVSVDYLLGETDEPCRYPESTR